MPTDTQREPSLIQQRIEAEREAEDARPTHASHCICDRCMATDAATGRARAATDEAVRKVEARMGELRGTLRNLRYHLTGRYENELVKMINDVLPPDDTTGGASDE